MDKVLDKKPNITIDDGADLVSRIHTKRKDLLEYIIGGTEETTTGIIRLKNLEKSGKLPMLELVMKILGREQGAEGAGK